MELSQLPAGWEAATQFHRLKTQLTRPLRKIVQERAVEEILGRARDMLRHASRPNRSEQVHWPEEGDLDLEASLENPRPWSSADLILHRHVPREVEVVVILDMSLSMTGEKLALTALAAAILKIKLEHVAVISFDTIAHVLVRAGEAVSVRELVRRILEVPAQGYTNIEAGLKAGLRELESSKRKERIGIILTDGHANVGWDPVRVALRFPRMHVVQVGREDRVGTQTCERMARAARGLRYRAVVYGQLPGVVRDLVRDCFGT
jgi:Mg-chelatase subunit ChlD